MFVSNARYQKPFNKNQILLCSPISKPLLPKKTIKTSAYGLEDLHLSFGSCFFFGFHYFIVSSLTFHLIVAEVFEQQRTTSWGPV